MAAEPKKKFKRIYAIVIIVVLLVVALSYAVYTLTYVAPTGPGPVEIEVVTDKPSYLQSEQVHFSIYVNNTQNWNVPKPSTVSFQIENYSSQTVCYRLRLSSPLSLPIQEHSFSMTSGTKKQEQASTALWCNQTTTRSPLPWVDQSIMALQQIVLLR